MIVEDLSKQYLSSEHGALQKAVSDLSSRTNKLQAQELELSSQIKTTSKALVTHTDRAKSQNVSRKPNVVVYVTFSVRTVPFGTFGISRNTILKH